MNEFIANFHFLRVYWLLLLAFPVIFYWMFFRGTSNKSSWENIVDKRLLDFLLIKGSSGQRKLISILALLGYTFAVIALAGPTWKKKETPTLIYDNPVIILLNLSSDMYADDIKPNRLTRAKHKIADLTKQIKMAQAGLIVYTDEPFSITPMTDDLKIIDNLMPSIDLSIMPTNGDRLDRAIAMAVDRLKSSKHSFGNIVIVASDVGQQFNQALQEARKASDYDYRINVLSITNDDSEKLQMIAERSGGVYVKITANDNDVIKIAEAINESISEELKISENFTAQWEDYGYYLLIIPMLCCLYFFRRGLLVIAFMLFATSAQAGFFLNDNQEGLKAFSNENFELAGEKFKNPEWKGASYYRLGDFGKAYQEFAKDNDIEALYNQGNALAKGGKIEEAVKKYEEVLEINPEHEDAKFNLEYLKQQQQNQSSDNNGNDDNNQNQQDQNSEQDDSSSNEENKDNQEQKQQSDDSENKDEQESKAKSQGEDENKEQQQGQREEEKNSPAPEQENQDNPAPSLGLEDTDEKEYDEEAQARELQYREIPEDPGGLLRAFIQKEYNRKRYGE